MSGLFPDIVMYPSRDFVSADSERFHSPEKISTLARRMEERGSRVLVVNRPAYPVVTAVRRPRKWSDWIERSRHVEQVAKNVFVLTPLLPIPDPLVYHIPGGSRVNRWLAGRAVRGALQQLRFSARRIAWLYHPYQLYYAGLIGEELLVYEICDQEDVRGLRGTIKTIRDLEPRILARADVVFATARTLVEAKRRYRPDIHWFPNAANVELFRRVQDPSLPMAEAVRDLPHPVIGYLGTIHHHTDIELVTHVAERRPDWTIVMIGPEENRAFAQSAVCRRFRGLTNVRMLGYIPQEETPAYCKAFDVGIIPYRTDSRFNYYVNPLKLHEYMAMGKPVVTTRIPEVETHNDLIWIADTPQDFEAGIEEALRTDGPDRIAERLRRAKENSWDVRVDGMLAIVEEALSRKVSAACGMGRAQ